MSEKLKNISEDIITQAKNYGATSVEALVVDNKALSIEVKNKNLEKIENAETLNLGLRVFVGSGSACVSISSANRKSIEQMALRAVEMAKEATADEFSLPANEQEILTVFNTNNYELCDSTYDEQNVEELKRVALEIESAALAVKDVTQCEGAGIGTNFSNFHMMTSNGFSSGYKKTNFQLFCSAIAGTNSLMERDYASESRTFFEDLPEAISIGQLAGNRAVNRLNPQKPLTGSYPVLFDERVSVSLIGHLTSAINGAAISRGSSWLRESLNKRVLPESFNLSEDPTRPRIAGSRPFDAEGLPTSKKNFIEDGILKSLILDLRSARKLNLTPSGNAYRSLSSAPQPGPGNLELSSDSKTVLDIIKKIKNGLFVTSLIGSTINQNTGDYSRGANGFWIQNGEITYPVNECTIAGNLKEMLLNLTAANDGRKHLSRVIPSLLVENMTIAGL
jgi:PmbA protein